jgi:hypothetical protein
MGRSVKFAISIILGISLPFGLPPLLSEPAAGQEEPAAPDPTWQRLGLPESGDGSGTPCTGSRT